MQTRLIRLRFLRNFRKGQKQVEGLSSQAEKQLEKNFFGRFERLWPVRRFVFGWAGLVCLLIAGLVAQNLSLSNYYQNLRTVPGGIYTEGVRGRFTNANPLFAVSEADTAISHLLFSGLFSINGQGKLVPALANDYSVDSHGTIYTVHLKPNLTWHDGKPLTSSDVVYTYSAIQNPDTQSPLQSSWQGITVSATDARTVVFKLPSALASFAYNFTNGIVPQHLLGKLPVSNLRSADFNTVHPVGSGPFAWQAIEVNGDGDPKTAQEQIALVPFNSYYAGKPKLQKFVVDVFAGQKQLIKAFESNRLTAMSGVNEVPRHIRDDPAVIRHNLTLRAANMVFFKTSKGVLSEQPVRQALVQSANVPSIVRSLDYSAREVREPLLTGQLGYDASLAQPIFNLKAAQTGLDTAGWKIGSKGVRIKDGKPLSFALTVANTTENHLVAGQLAKQWQAVGAQVTLRFFDTSDFQNSVTSHDYDAILNGISIGVDPDVFVYWDSSQADIRSNNRLNLSEYKNATADDSLESGRTRLDATLRVIKYKPFLQAWQHDSPALALYQPRLLYLTNGVVSGLADDPVTTSTDRYANVQNWQIRQAKVTD